MSIGLLVIERGDDGPWHDGNLQVSTGDDLIGSRGFSLRIMMMQGPQANICGVVSLDYHFHVLCFFFFFFLKKMWYN